MNATLSIAHLLGRPTAKEVAAKIAPARTRKTNSAVVMAKPQIRVPTTKGGTNSAASPKRAKSVSFAHLAPTPDGFYDDIATPPAGHAKASAIVAAAAKARGVIPVTKPPQGTFAAQVAAASAKAQSVTGTGAPKPTGTAAAILAAGRKRRGATV
jgi:hypothetical protein